MALYSNIFEKVQTENRPYVLTTSYWWSYWELMSLNIFLKHLTLLDCSCSIFPVPFCWIFSNWLTKKNFSKIKHILETFFLGSKIDLLDLKFWTWTFEKINKRPMRYQNHQNYSRNTLMYLISGKPHRSLNESKYLRVVFLRWFRCNFLLPLSGAFHISITIEAVFHFYCHGSKSHFLSRK